MRVAPASAGRDPCERRADSSHSVTASLTLAGRSLGCPALFPFHSAAAVLVSRCAERRRLLSPGGRRQKFPETKPPAFVGIDDRVLTFEGEWPSMEQLLAFKPWNKRRHAAPDGEGG